MANNAADDADDATAAAADNDDALPTSMPLIKEANGGEGDNNDAPTTLLLARFIQIFTFGLTDPSSLPLKWSGGRGDMNRHVPQGGADSNRKGLEAVVLTWRNVP